MSNPTAVEMSIPPAPPDGPNIGKVKDGEAVMEVNIIKKSDFKKQVCVSLEVAGRGLQCCLGIGSPADIKKTNMKLSIK